MKPCATLALVEDASPVTTSLLAAAACTAMPVSLPVTVAVEESVAVIDRVPAVSSVTEKACVPASVEVNV